MSKFLTFLRREDGAVTVDYVVLLAVATGAAVATAGVLSRGVKTADRAVEMQLVSSTSVGDTWAQAMRDYTPHDAEGYNILYEDFTSLTNAELDVMEGVVNHWVAQLEPYAETTDDHGVLNDLTFSLGRVYAERVRGRPGATTFDAEAALEITTRLGWDQYSVVGG